MKEQVVGIGGAFIYSEDPEALASWYARHLGVECEQMGDGKVCYKEFFHRDIDGSPRGSRVTFAILHTERKPQGRAYMLNFRVQNLERLLNQLDADDVEIENVEVHDHGVFAWIYDSDGNRVELCQDVEN